ncbi:radical SAM protein [bacterium]|nr:radical SAM protein [bacterium]
MSFCSSEITNFEFPMEEINKIRDNNGLLSMEIEFSLRCNFKCPYCYTENEKNYENELSVEEIKDTIVQAKGLGAKKIIILGGEPMVYPHTMEIIRYISGLDLEIEMFTNGSKITPEIAEELFRLKVRVVLKMNTFDKELQNKLSGTNKAHEVIHSAFKNLKSAGYPSEESVLAISTIICKQNEDELVDFWQWLRDQNILPYFEMITPQENAKQNEWLYLEPDKVYKIFRQLAEIDAKKYGNHWDPQPPLVGNKCLRHQFSCLVNSKGDVLPCVGVTIPVGNIRQKKLSKILSESIIVKNLRNYHTSIKGACSTCEKSDHCYGCRGAAYQMTGDYLASDPLCWLNYNCAEKVSNSSVEDLSQGKIVKIKPKTSVA